MSDEPADPPPFVVVKTEPEPISTRPRTVKAAIPSGRARRRKRVARVIGIAGLALAMLIVLVAYWLGTLGRSCAKVEWTTVSPPGAGFSILMPGPQHRRTTNATDWQGKKVVHEIVASRMGSVIFLVDHSELGFDLDPAKSKTFFDNYRNAYVRARSAKVVKETDLGMVGTLHGREFCDEFMDPEPGSKGRTLTSRTRVFVDGRRCFSIHAIAPKGSGSPEEIAEGDRFLQSFCRIAEPQSPPVVAAIPEEQEKLAAPAPDATETPKPPAAEPPKAMADANPPAADGLPNPAANPTPEGRSPVLRYSWVPGKTAVYAAKIVIDGGDRFHVTLEGHSLYRLKAADADGFTIAYQGRFRERKLLVVNAWSRGQMVDSLRLSDATIKLNAKGRVSSLEGRFPLPLIGDLATLILEPFSEEFKDEWTVTDHLVTLTRIPRDTTPIGFRMPAFRDRGQVQPPNDPVRRPGGRRVVVPIIPPPAGDTMLATDHLAFRLGAIVGEIVPIDKSYSMQTELRVDGKPQLSMEGKGSIQFDRSRGLPISIAYKALATARTSNSEFRVPMALEFHLVEGADREKVLGTPTAEGAAPAPTVDIAGAELDRLLADLGSGERKAHQACRTLADATPVPARRSQLARALEARLDTTDTPFRLALVKAPETGEMKRRSRCCLVN